MSSKVEMRGHCLRCDEETVWRACDGWVFHTLAQHWRCSICNCATQPQRYMTPDQLAKVEAYEAERRSVVVEIDL